MDSVKYFVLSNGMMGIAVVKDTPEGYTLTEAVMFFQDGQQMGAAPVFPFVSKDTPVQVKRENVFVMETPAEKFVEAYNAMTGRQKIIKASPKLVMPA
jgi:hypothetical protein